MKKFFKILIWIVVIAIFIGTFVYLFINSSPKETVYELVKPTRETIERTTAHATQLALMRNILSSCSLSCTKADL